MNVRDEQTRGIKWRAGRRTAAALSLTATLLAFAPIGTGAARAAGRPVSIIVRETPDSGAVARQAVRDLGGSVGRRLGIIHGFVARVPSGGLSTLRGVRGVYSVTRNARVRFSSLLDGFDPTKSAGSWCKWATNTHVKDMWHNGYTGQGVDVALIDSGVSPVPGIDGPTKVVNGPDLSFDSQAPNLRYLDGYGHGTFMAGLIAGRDSSIPATKEDEMNCSAYEGAAPGARVVNVKVGAANGATDVSQVLAAIDWVVQHRNDNGMNIRVLNLSFGTDSKQSYLLDPLSYAAEVAWFRGIVVVVAGGNTGFGNAQLNDPAFDPYVLAVAADDTKGTDSPDDDVIPDFQTRGNSARHPDLAGPGKSVVALRDPGSQIDQGYPSARQGTTRFFRGSGSSEATAIVSGFAADLLQQHPEYSPDQVKYVLTHTAAPLKNTDQVAQGSGLVNMKNAMGYKIPLTAVTAQAWPRSTGLGSLQDARGSLRVVDSSGVALSGEQDIFGQPWDAKAWSANSWSGNSWSAGTWNGNSWSGNSWSGNSWSANTWSANSWSAHSWSGNSWSANSWSANSWSGNSWSGGDWGDSAGVTSPYAGNSWSSGLWGD